MQKIICLGDSHISLFLGKDALAPIYPEHNDSLFPYFEVYRLGPITAYNIGNIESKTQAKLKIDEILEQNFLTNGILLFSAGEIDIRVHLLKQSILQGVSVDSICDSIIDNYLELLNGYSKKGYKIIVLSAPPSSFITYDDPEYPRYGSELERNKATFIYNRILKDKAQKRGFVYIDIYSYNVRPDFTTVKDSLWDGVHPSTKNIPAVIKALNLELNLDLDLPISWLFREFLREIKNKYLI